MSQQASPGPSAPQNFYRVEQHRRFRRFLRRHPEFAEEHWPQIEQVLSSRPYLGPRITHLKSQLLCSRRGRAGSYRLLYDISDTDMVVHIFDGDVRGDIY